MSEKRIFEFKRFTHEPIGLEDFAAHLSDRHLALLLGLQVDLISFILYVFLNFKWQPGKVVAYEIV